MGEEEGEDEDDEVEAVDVGSKNGKSSGAPLYEKRAGLGDDGGELLNEDSGRKDDARNMMLGMLDDECKGEYTDIA